MIVNAGIGDSDRMIEQENVGVLVRDFNEDEYAKAAATIFHLLDHPEETRRHMQSVAERLFDLKSVGVERYARLYEALLN